MRIEGIGDGNGNSTGLPNRAFEQARALRTATRPPVPATPVEAAQNKPAATFVVKDVHDSPPPSDERTEAVASAVASAAAAMQAASAAPRTSSPVEPKQIDTDGDGWIDVNDLPYDYFQIVRRTNIKLRSEPIDASHVAGPGAGSGVAAAGATATAIAPATGRLSATMVAAMDAI
jgi:hypothetical protein